MGLWNLIKVASTLTESGIAKGRDIDNLSGWIWEEIMGYSKHIEKTLGPGEEGRLLQVINRLATGEPIQYIAGHAWFYGIKVKVTPDVLIPRPETEELVHWILTDLRNRPSPKIRILDIGTGSGCIAIALKKELGDKAQIVAMDISIHALAVANENAFLHEEEIKFIQQDFLKDGINELGIFNIIVSNPPYISWSSAGEEIVGHLRFEPALALYPDDEDPDIFYKKMAAFAMDALAPGGTCYLEMNEFRSDQIQSYFKDKGWSYIEPRMDLQGADRMLKVKYRI